MAALVIGNSAYPDPDGLTNPVNDATDFGTKLKGYGFEVIVSVDLTAKEMERKLKDFRTLLETHEVGLFFFAGHGMQIEGKNYLLAIDTDMTSETDAKHSALSLDKVIDVLANSKASTRIIVLDACRNNPWERSWSRGPSVRGLASVYAPKGTIIGFATSPGEVAFDGVGRNGTYTSALLQHIDTPDCSIEMMFKGVRNTVAAASAGKQTTWEHTSLSGEFYFNLSLGKLIEEYDGAALADSLFTLNPTKKSHEIIAGLKSHNWYRQNAALAMLTPDGAARMAANSLFVMGRNIYQAACGGSSTAIAFINNFMISSHKYGHDKRKSLLDGMLFEIFFDAEGKIRKRIKSGMFNNVFDLQRYGDLHSSFDFIAEALNAARADFYTVPGKGHELLVSVSTKKKKDGLFVNSVYVGGIDVLRFEEDAWDTGDGKPIFMRIDIDEFQKQLSEELVVPIRALKITYTMPEAAKSDELRIPMGWTVRKGGSEL